MSQLFEERIQELVTLDKTLQALPKKYPDRVVGLRETRNITQLLDQPPRFQTESDEQQLRQLIRCSPFKEELEPLLFPFLVLEAKHESSAHSFVDIQTQSSFPIWTLLSLQKDLQDHRPDDTGRPEPLVWSLGYKGSDWRIYGCYISDASNASPTYVGADAPAPGPGCFAQMAC